MFGQKFEASLLCGGFSGSIVLRVQPYSLEGRSEEAVIVKLDRAEPIREEVVNSHRVFKVGQILLFWKLGLKRSIPPKSDKVYFFESWD